MNFFKHFTDAHEGKSLTSLMNEFGLEGYGAYFVLMELCAKKLNKEPDEEFTTEHCRFIFNERTLRERLRMRRAKLLDLLSFCVDLDLFECSVGGEKLLRRNAEDQQKFNYSSTKVQLLSTLVQQEFNFYVPKLLECLDRDTKRARTVRAVRAPRYRDRNRNTKDMGDTVNVERNAPTAPTQPTRAPLDFSRAQNLGRPATDHGTAIENIDDLRRKIPIITWESWQKKYPDRSWIDCEIAKAFEFHCADPAMRPRTTGAWMKKLITWLSIGWERRSKPDGKVTSIAEMIARGDLV